MKIKYPATANSNYKVEYYKNTVIPEWDEAVINSRGDVMMTSAWGNYETRLQYRPCTAHLLLVRENGAIAAGIQIVVYRYSFLGNIGISYGIVCPNEKLPNVLNILASEIKKLMVKHRISYMGAALEKEGDHELEPYLKAAGFHIKPPKLPPYHSYDATILLDLTLSVDEIFNKMKRERRNRIRKGLKNPVEFKVGTRDDIPTFYRLYEITASKYNSKPLYSLDDLFKLWDTLAPNGWVVIHLGIVEGKVICASMGYPFGTTYYNNLWGWNGEYSQYNISDVVDWNSIVWAKENGFKFYDFVYVDSKCTDAILSPDPVPESIRANPLFGPAYYKTQFGGYQVKFARPVACYSSKLKWLLFHVILNRITVRKNISLNILMLNVSKFLRRN